MSNMKFNNELPQLKNLNMSHIIDYKDTVLHTTSFTQNLGVFEEIGSSGVVKSYKKRTIR